MKRLRRILLNAATALSLALCVATVALWVRSHRTLDGYDVFRMSDQPSGGVYFGVEKRVSLFSACGRIGARIGISDPRAARAWSFPIEFAGHSADVRPLLIDNVIDVMATQQAEARWRLGGLAYASEGPAGFVQVLLVPHWMVLVLASMLPTWVVLKRFRHCRRTIRSRCPACGYDLRATPGRCPECGAAPAPPPSAAAPPAEPARPGGAGG